MQGDIVKNFVVSADHQNGHRVEYDVSAYLNQMFSLHWADGKPEGFNKNVKLKATVNGKPMLAKTIVKVVRPKVTIYTTVAKSKIVFDQKSQQWNGATELTFDRTDIQEGGSARWV